jgi:hypothetical protein
MVPRQLREFCVWLDQTPLSQAFQSTDWLVPTLQTVHIISVALIVGSVLMINLRLLGWSNIDLPLDRVCARFLPFIWWPLLALLATGTIMIIGEPARSLQNPVFQLKITLIVIALVTIAIFQHRVRRAAASETAGVRGYTAPAVIALFSALLWGGIIVAGRWIAYS